MKHNNEIHALQFVIVFIYLLFNEKYILRFISDKLLRVKVTTS